MKKIFWIPLVILLLLIGFFSGVIFTVKNTPEPVPVITTPTETSLEKCIHLCKDNDVINCFSVCVDRLTCQNDIILI